MGKELEQEQAVKQEPTPTGTTSGSHHFAKISTFYGETGKGEVSFYTWKYEVRCLLEEKVYREEQILQGIRRSCKGEAANILRRLCAGVRLKKYLRSLRAPMDI